MGKAKHRNFVEDLSDIQILNLDSDIAKESNPQEKDIIKPLVPHSKRIRKITVVPFESIKDKFI